jgi:tetratricopeptide (TPR) repeat protein/tRNA A-37 threonylcarbamoyl transferase component Bud32
MSDHDPNSPNEQPTSFDTDGTDATRAAGEDGTAETATSGGEVPPPPSLKRLGDFELLRELGRGGMGVVYEARQVSLKRRVALKVLPPAMGLTPQARQRFEREAQAAAKLHHTNIVPVHAIGDHDGHHFYAMDLIEGQSLDHVLRDVADAGSNPLLDQTVTRAASELTKEEAAPTDSTPATTSQGGGATSSLGDTSAGSRPWFDAVARLIAEVADGLDYAHGRGVIHRDIKPANLMLSGEGRLCITDFGLARIVQEPGMTVSGSFLGTPAYMSPEQIAAGRVKLDHRTDVYSLGAVLYEMLTLQRPFAGDSREEVLSAIMTKDPRAPRKSNGKIPQDLETICLKALEKDPDRRYATAGELAQDLRQFLQGGLIAAKRAGVTRRAWKAVRRHPVAASVTVGALAVALVGTFAVQQYAGRSKATVGQLISEARLALREGQNRDALASIDRAVAMAPSDIEAKLVRAKALKLNWFWGEAADEARAVLDREPDNWTAHAILAGLGHWDNTGDYGLPAIPIEEHRRFVEANAPETAEAYYLRSLSAESATERAALLDRALELNPGDSVALVERMNTAGGLLQDLEEAVALTDRLITARPRSAQGWRMKADFFRQLGDLDRATAAIERAMELDDEDPWNHVQHSWILGASGDQEAALAAITKAVELNPADAALHQYRTGPLSRLGRLEEAAAEARKAIELNPQNPRAYGPLFNATMSLGRKDEAREVIDQLRREADTWVNDKAISHAYLNVAQWLRNLKEPEDALAAIDHAITVDPDPWMYVVRRWIHRDLGEFDAAEADCDAIAELEVPDEPRPVYNRGHVLSWGCERPEAGLPDLTRAIELAPRWHEAYRQRGSALHNLRRYEEALEDLTRAVELAPHQAVYWNTRAVTYWYLGRFDEATADLERALELQPRDATYINNLGAIYARRGRLLDAIEQVERAIEIAPNNAFNLSVLASYYLNVGRFEDAIEMARRSIEIDPDSRNREWETYPKLAAASLRLGRADEARAAIEAMVARTPGWEDRASSGAHGAAAGLYLYLDDVDGARSAAERAVEIDPDNHGGWITRGLVRRRADDLAGWRDDCRRAASIDLSTAPELTSRAWQRTELCDDFEGALADAGRALEHVPDDPTAFLHLGQANLKLGREAAAEDAFDRAIRSDPRDRRLRVVRAWLWALTDRCDEAEADLETAMDAGSQDPGIQGWVAWTHAALLARQCPGLYDGAEALDLARRAAEAHHDSDWGLGYRALGWVSYREGDHPAARDAFERAVEWSLVDDAISLFGLAMTHAKLGNTGEARATYDRAVARMQASAPNWPLLIRLRAEAAGVLGIRDASRT